MAVVRTFIMSRENIFEDEGTTRNLKICEKKHAMAMTIMSFEANVRNKKGCKMALEKLKLLKVRSLNQTLRFRSFLNGQVKIEIQKVHFWKWTVFPPSRKFDTPFILTIPISISNYPKIKFIPE